MTRKFALMAIYITSLSAQNRVAPEMLYHRVWAVVPMIGKGTAEDPRQPMFVPSPQERKAQADGAERVYLATGKRPDPQPPAILGYTMQLSDDKQSALVEFIGASPQALVFITQSKAPGVKAFERGKATRQEVEAEFRKFRRDFRMEQIQGRGQ
jgi:hypothetical protein